MDINAALSGIGARLGTTFSTTSKPTEVEATEFIHQSIRMLTQLLETRFFDTLKTNIVITLPAPITIPTDYDRFVSLVNVTKGEEYRLLGSEYLGAIKTGKDNILLPEYASVINEQEFVLNNGEDSDEVELSYLKKYTDADIVSIDDQFLPIVVVYSTYLAKFQDEESTDTQIVLQEFASLLQGFGVNWKGAGNE